MLRGKAQSFIKGVRQVKHCLCHWRTPTKQVQLTSMHRPIVWRTPREPNEESQLSELSDSCTTNAGFLLSSRPAWPLPLLFTRYFYNIVHLICSEGARSKQRLRTGVFIIHGVMKKETLVQQVPRGRVRIPEMSWLCSWPEWFCYLHFFLLLF